MSNERGYPGWPGALYGRRAITSGGLRDRFLPRDPFIDQPHASRVPAGGRVLRAGHPVVDVRVRAGRTLVWACVGAEGPGQRTPIGVPLSPPVRLEVDRMDVDGESVQGSSRNRPTFSKDHAVGEPDSI
jgi:hypothetical protein